MIFFLYGADTFRSRQKLQELRAKFLRDVDPLGTNVVTLDGASMTIDDFRNASSALSMFAKRRFVVVERLLADGKGDVQEGIAALLERTDFPEDHIVVFWEETAGKSHIANRKSQKRKEKSSFKKATEDAAKTLRDFLLRQKYVQEFAPLQGAALHRWIRERGKVYDATLHSDVVEELTLRVGDNLWQADQEIRKLTAYTSTVTRAHVQEMVHGKFDETIFALTDAIGARAHGRALALIEHERAQGTNHVYLLAMIIRQFRILLMVREALDRGATERNMTSTLALHPFVVRKAIEQAAAFTKERLQHLYERLFAIERDFKTTRKDPAAVLTSFIVSV